MIKAEIYINFTATIKCNFYKTGCIFMTHSQILQAGLTTSMYICMFEVCCVKSLELKSQISFLDLQALNLYPNDFSLKTF